MPLTHGQISVRGLVMGPGTDYIVTHFNPWNRLTKAEYTGSAPWSDGSWSGAEFLESVTVNIGIHPQATGPEHWQELHWGLTTAFAPIGTASQEIELRWCVGAREYVMFGRPRSLQSDVRNFFTGDVGATASFQALDPSIYSAELRSARVRLLETTGGVSAPVGAPVSIVSAFTSGIVEIENEGTRPASLQLRIRGPVINPRVMLVTPDGEVMTLRTDIALSDGQWLDIDTETRLVMLNGTSPRLNAAYGSWPFAYPGTSKIYFRGTGQSDTALLEISHRDRW